MAENLKQSQNVTRCVSTRLLLIEVESLFHYLQERFSTRRVDERATQEKWRGGGAWMWKTIKCFLSAAPIENRCFGEQRSRCADRMRRAACEDLQRRQRERQKAEVCVHIGDSVFKAPLIVICWGEQMTSCNVRCWLVMTKRASSRGGRGAV